MSEVDFQKINEEIFTYINQARTEPEIFMKNINQRMMSIDERNSFVSNGIRYRTKEGQEACGELISHIANLVG